MDSVPCKASARGFPFKRSLPSRPLGRGLKGRRQSCQRWGSTLGVLGPIATLWRSRLAAVEAAEAPTRAQSSKRRRRRRAPKEEEAQLVQLVAPKGDTWPGFPTHRRSGEVAAGLKTGKFLIGRLRCPRNMTRGLVFVPDVGEFVVKGSEAMNRAVDGDLVVIERAAKERDAEEGTDEKVRAKVVAINQRSQREIGGTIYKLSDLEDEEEVLSYKGVEPDDLILVPANQRFPRILLSRSDIESLKAEIKDWRVTAVLTNWSQFCQLPRGRCGRPIGPAGTLEVETEIILLEHDVSDAPFQKEVMKCLPPADFQISEEETKKRRDFRDLCTFSIDPPGCEDVDDALSCVQLENGNFSVGVHIADVTHFVKPGSPLDREAAERATSVYLVNRRIDMLPRLLTTDICSLRCDGKDRLCFSAVMEMTCEAKVVNAVFTKGVLRSRAALSYKEAQERLDRGDSDEIGKALQRLASLAQKLRAQRFQDGAIELEGGELKFELDSNTQLPTNVFKYETFFTNELIEEFMLLANRHVAEEISRSWKKISLLRRHPPPKETHMDSLVKLLEASGIKNFSYGSNKELQKSLEKVEKKEDPFFNRLVRVMTTRCMEEALYFCTGQLNRDQWQHYGLAMDTYTHFTSPIRRYADCVVHRLLSASQGLEELPHMLRKPEELNDACEHLNYKNKNARWADRASVNFHLYQFFLERGRVLAEGVVMRVLKDCIEVAVEEYGAEGIAEMESSSWGVLLEQQKFYGRPTTKFEGLEINVFDRVVVAIEADQKDLSRRLLKITFLGMPNRLPDGSKAPMPKADLP